MRYEGDYGKVVPVLKNGEIEFVLLFIITLLFWIIFIFNYFKSSGKLIIWIIEYDGFMGWCDCRTILIKWDNLV